MSHEKSAPLQFLRHLSHPFGVLWVIHSWQVPLSVLKSTAQMLQRVPPGFVDDDAGQTVFSVIKRVDLPQLMHLYSSSVGRPGRFGPMMCECVFSITCKINGKVFFLDKTVNAGTFGPFF